MTSYDAVSRVVIGAGVDQRLAYHDVAADTLSFPTVNHQGSAILMTREDGTYLTHYTYDAYGEEMTGASGSGFPYLYTGRRFDAQTGLYYYRARYYSPVLGRFLQTDPIGTADQMNLYAYVGNDPLNATDPSGMVSREDASAISKCVYDTDCSGTGNYSRVDPEEYGIKAHQLENPNSGFRAGIFSNGDEVVLAFAGTDPSEWGDIKTDLLQGGGFRTEQYDSSVGIARRLVANLNGLDVAFTGHSLGGGLAALAGDVTGGEAVTFNAAGVSRVTRMGYGTIEYSTVRNITNHVTTGDILTAVQVTTGAPDALGKQEYHGSPYFWSKVHIYGVKRHSVY